MILDMFFFFLNLFEDFNEHYIVECEESKSMRMKKIEMALDARSFLGAIQNITLKNKNILVMI